MAGRTGLERSGIAPEDALELPYRANLETRMGGVCRRVAAGSMYGVGILADF